MKIRIGFNGSFAGLLYSAGKINVINDLLMHNYHYRDTDYPKPFFLIHWQALLHICGVNHLCRSMLIDMNNNCSRSLNIAHTWRKIYVNIATRIIQMSKKKITSAESFALRSPFWWRDLDIIPASKICGCITGCIAGIRNYLGRQWDESIRPR